MPVHAKEISNAENAIEKGDPLLLATALINGVDPSSRVDDNGTTLLHRACEVDAPVMATMLLEKGANVNARDNLGKTPAFIAADNGRNGTLLVLGKFGADFNVADNAGEFPIHRAARKGHQSAISTLLALKTNAVVQTKDDGATALHLCSPSACVECAKILIGHGAPVEARDYDGLTPLIWAVQRENIELVRIFLENGSSVNVCDNEGRTPLIWAATKHDSPALIRLLLQRGANPSIKDAMGHDAVSRARLVGHKAVEKELLQATQVRHKQ